MPTKPIDRLLFAQGGTCFFCEAPLSPAEASVEHLVSSTNGGSNSDENCVVCCKALNSLLGRMALKEKLRVVLNQKGKFKCPGGGAGKVPIQTTVSANDRLALVVADLHKRGSQRPRTLKTLTNTINAVFQKKLTEHEIALLLGKLEAQGLILVTGTKVSYELPPIDA